MSHWLLFALVCSLAAAPPKPTVTVPSAALKTYDIADFVVDNVPVVDTPFNPRRIMLDASITTPAGKVMKVPGFGNHDVTGGLMVWHVRFAPPLAGSYTGTVTVTMPDGATSSDPFNFTVAQGTSKGMIHVAKNEPTQLEFDDGSPFIAVGLDELSTTKGSQTQLYSGLFSRNAQNGANWARVWISLYWVGTMFIEGSRPYAFSEAGAAAVDTMLMQAQKYGMYIQLCMEHVRSICPGGDYTSGPFWDPTFPYNTANGGPCSSDDQFFTLPESQAMFKARIRYIVARYGAYSSVCGWELWNEIGSLSAALDGNIAVVWHDTMSQYTHRIDPYNHTFVAEFSWAFSLKGIDCIQGHLYQGGDNAQIGPGIAACCNTFARGIAGAFNDVTTYGKPWLYAEGGVSTSSYGRSPYYDQDSAGYAYHEEVWASFFQDAYGTLMNWWFSSIQSKNWDSKFWPVYRKFVSDLPVNQGFRKAAASSSVANLTVWSKTGPWGTAAWLWDNTANWESQVIDKKTPRTISGGTVTLPVAGAGSYRMICMNTWTGDTLSKGDVTATGTSVTVSLPSFSVDVAVKLLNKSYVPVAASADRPIRGSRPSISIMGSTVRTASPVLSTIAVYDLRGVKVIDYNVSGGAVCVPLRLAPGYYVVRTVAADRNVVMHGAAVGP